jgi:hypothetical protein
MGRRDLDRSPAFGVDPGKSGPPAREGERVRFVAFEDGQSNVPVRRNVGDRADRLPHAIILPQAEEHALIQRNTLPPI